MQFLDNKITMKTIYNYASILLYTIHLYIKVVTYILFSIVKQTRNKTDEKREISFLFALSLVDIYLILFVFTPLIHLISSSFYDLITDDKHNLLIFISVIIAPQVYFFKIKRISAYYEEVKSFDAQKRRKLYENLLILFIAITFLSCVYQYNYFSFGRW